MEKGEHIPSVVASDAAMFSVVAGEDSVCVREGTAATSPFFSIVMPVYGVEKYIERAISCISNQTFRDWELIVVDDCTPDESARIAKDYARRDPRVRLVHHKTNRGLSEARNTGIREACGTYLWMPDPDDTYDIDLLERAHATISEIAGTTATISEAQTPDVVMFGYAENYFDENDNFLYTHALPIHAGTYGAPESWHPLVIDFERGTHYGYAWNKIYRLSRIQKLNLAFENVRLIEDITFNVAFFQDAASLCVLEGTPYYYAKRAGKSLTNANAYSAQTYYELHLRRVSMLYKQLASWGVLDAQAASTLGALYGRYVLSTLERQCVRTEGLNHASRRARTKEMFSEPLFSELIPNARAQGKALKVSLALLKTRNVSISLALGRAIHIARMMSYKTFTRARSER